MRRQPFLACALRLYAILLLICPPRFRADYGSDMAAVFRARCERARRRGGRTALVACGVVGLVDLVTVGLAVRMASLRPSHSSVPGHPPFRGDSMFTHALMDLRVACRAFVRQPFFSAVIVCTLALGIGATVAMFGVVDAAVLRPVRVPDADRIVSLVLKDPRFGTAPFAPPYLVDLRERMRGVDRIAGFSPSWQFVLTGNGDPRLVTGAYVSDGLFDLFQVTPVHGRTFVADEYVPGGPAVALVSEAFWQRAFGAAALQGQTLLLDGRSHTIVGTLPPDFRMPITASTVSRESTSAEIWLPFSLNPYRAARAIPVMNIVGRLGDGVTNERAQQELAAVGASLARDHPDTSAGAELLSIPLNDLVSRDVRTPLTVLLAAVALLLVVACANVGHMLLARSAERDSEMAVRSSLGATHARLAAQLFVESATLATAGAAAGLLIAWWALGAVSALGWAGLPPSARVGLDWRVAGFAVVTAMVTTLLVGAVPIVRVTRRAPRELLGQGARVTGGRAARVRDVLVVVEVALAVVLLVGGGLLARSFIALTSVNPGFSADQVLAGSVALPAAKYGEPAARRAFVDEALVRLSALPGVERAALVNRLPFGGGNVLVGVEVAGKPQPDGQPVRVDRRVVSPEYFDAMSIPVLDGQTFAAEHRADSGDRVAVLNATMAARFWPGDSALGQRVRLMLRTGPGPWLRVVGVVGDVRHHGLDQTAQPEVYVPYSQASVESFVLVVRTSREPRSLASAMRAEIQRLSPDLPVEPLAPAADAIRASVAEPRLRTSLLGAFAAMALALAAMGVYGVLSLSVAKRTREIGIRVALGAERGAIVRLVIGRGLKLVAGGAAAGIVLSLVVTRQLERLLFGVGPADPLTFAAVAALLLITAVAASYFPARRAVCLDPVQALRLD
jgi:putative ABC transport system permease protein